MAYRPFAFILLTLLVLLSPNRSEASRRHIVTSCASFLSGLDNLDHSGSIGLSQEELHLFKRAGYPAAQATLLRNFAMKHGMYLMIRGRVFPHVVADDVAALPKPVWIKIRTARKGPWKGFLVKPSAMHFSPGHEMDLANDLWQKYWPEISSRLKIDPQTGVITDLEGHRYMSDYDLFAAFDTRDGHLIKFGNGSEAQMTRNLIQINRLLTPGVQDPRQFLVQHGSLLEWLPLEKVTNRYLPILFFTPDGHSGLITSHHELDEFLAEIKASQR